MARELFNPITGEWNARGRLSQRLRQIGETRPTCDAADLDVVHDARFVSDDALTVMIGKASTLYQIRRASRATALALTILTNWDASRLRYARIEYHRARASLRALCAEAARRAKAHRAADRMLSRAVKMAGQGVA